MTKGKWLGRLPSNFYTLWHKQDLLMRIASILFTALFFIFISNPLHAALDRCPRHQVQTSLKSKLAGTKIYKGASEDFSDYVLGHHRGESKVLGFINQAEIYTKLKYEFDIKEVGKNRYCVNLKEVSGYFYAAPKLYLPTDYKKSSCEYQEIRKHENKHLQVVYDFHKRNTGKYSSHLGRVARAVPIFPPVTTQKEADEIKQHIINYFESEFRAFEEKELARLYAMQAKIDNQQEYIGVRKRCNNW